MAGRGVQAVLLDMGGVLLDWNPRHLYRKLIADPQEMERLGWIYKSVGR